MLDTDAAIHAAEAAGANARSQRREERKTPEAVAARKKGRNARRRGLKFEQTVARYLGGFWVPMSGMLGGRLMGDVLLGPFRLQSKKTTALKTIRKWLDHDKSDILVQGDPDENVADAVVAMRASTFLAIRDGLVDWTEHSRIARELGFEGRDYSREGESDG